MNKKNCNKAISIIKYTLNEIEKHLNNDKHIEKSFNLIDKEYIKIIKDDMNIMKKNLNTMLYELENDKLTYTSFGMGREIADVWPNNTEIGDLILDSEQSYKRCCQISNISPKVKFY